MVAKTNDHDQTRLGEYVPTPDTTNKSFQEDSHGNFRIFVEGKFSQWQKYNEIAFLKVEDRAYIGVTDFYRDYLPKRCALKVEVVDEDGETNFYKFKIIDLMADTVLDKDDVEDLLREPSFAEEDYTFNIKESKLKDFVKIAITDFRELPLMGRIMTKEDVEEYLKDTLLSEEFEVVNEDGEKINTK